MKKILLKSSSVVVLLLMLNGCASVGLSTASHITNVQLTSPNFHIVATNVTGEASSKALLGMSYGLGMAAAQLAIIPLSDNRMLYKTAMQNLWANFEKTNGPMANRKLALVNLRYDSESLNTLLYTKLTTAVIADVIEFE